MYAVIFQKTSLDLNSVKILYVLKIRGSNPFYTVAADLSVSQSLTSS